MASKRRHLDFIVPALALLFAVGCTDRRQAERPTTFATQSSIPNIVAAADVKWVNNSDMQIYQMQVKNGSLFVTGKPVGFSRWDISADPENPHKTFASGEDIQNFPKYPGWLFDGFAAGAMSIIGNLAFLSGNLGTSVVSMSDTTAPREVYRYPITPEDSIDIRRDPAFTFTASIINGSVFYGFREQDFLYTYAMNGANLSLIRKDAYVSTGVTKCCVRGATTFAGRIFVAFQSELWIIPLTGSSSLGAVQKVTSLNAVNVASSATHLYVQHEPTSAISGGSGVQPGIYVFDLQGNNVAYLAIRPLKFAVTSDDRHIYANMDNRSIRIFRVAADTFASNQ